MSGCEASFKKSHKDIWIFLDLLFFQSWGLQLMITFLIFNAMTVNEWYIIENCTLASIICFIEIKNVEKDINILTLSNMFTVKSKIFHP